jgi:amino acid transporter
MQKKLSLFSLVLLIVAAIDSIRTLPTTAFFGESLVFFFILSALIFLVPVAFISAEFSSRYPEQGGVFHWIRQAFGEKTGVLGVWLQWINTMIWYPTMLLFIAGTAAHLINPALAENKVFLVSTTVALFWGLTLLNLKGIHVSAKINSFCGTIGTLFPMILLISLGIGWMLLENPLSISYSLDAMIPSFSLEHNGGAIVTIMASFLGMELAGVHVNDILNPQKNFPKAIGYSVLILLGTLIFGALSIATVIPNTEIRFVDGIMQTFTSFFDAFHIPFLTPILAVLIIVGGLGGSINWLLSPAKGLLQTAEYGFLPNFLIVKNSHGVSVRILVLQAVFVSVLCFSINLLPTINAFYWFLMALSTGLYMLMYMLLFIAALKLGRPPKDALNYQIPLGFRTISCIAGLFACLLTILVVFQPSPEANVGSALRYGGLIAAGLIAMVAPVALLWFYKEKKMSRFFSSVPSSEDMPS